MTRPILVATDFSKNADHALSVALAWGEQMNVPVHLVHVMRNPAEIFGPLFERAISQTVSMKDEMIELAQDSLNKELDNVAPGRKNPVSKVVLEGNPEDEILKYAKLNDVGLIVTGMKGHGFFERLVLGSLTEKLMAHSPVSVLAVHPNSPQLPKSALYCCDFTRSNKFALEWAKIVNREMAAKIDLLHLITPRMIVQENNWMDESPLSYDQALANCEKFVEQALSEILPEFEEGKVSKYVSFEKTRDEEDFIVEFAEEKLHDLIILGARDKADTLKSWAMGSVSQSVAKIAPTSVLVAR